MQLLEPIMKVGGWVGGSTRARTHKPLRHSRLSAVGRVSLSLDGPLAGALAWVPGWLHGAACPGSEAALCPPLPVEVATALDATHTHLTPRSLAAVPVPQVEVVTPEDHMGDVIGDLNSRRGIVQE